MLVAGAVVMEPTERGVDESADAYGATRIACELREFVAQRLHALLLRIIEHAHDELAGGRFLELDAKERAAVLQKVTST